MFFLKKKKKKSVEIMFVQPLQHTYNYDQVMIIN